MTKPTTIQDGKHVNIKRSNPDKVRPISVNDFMISHDKNEFFLTFSSIEPPAVFTEEELASVNEVDSVARVKVVVSPEFAERILKVMEQNIESYKNEKSL
jgi:hypothetical protein